MLIPLFHSDTPYILLLSSPFFSSSSSPHPIQSSSHCPLSLFVLHARMCGIRWWTGVFRITSIFIFVQNPSLSQWFFLILLFLSSSSNDTPSLSLSQIFFHHEFRWKISIANLHHDSSLPLSFSPLSCLLHILSFKPLSLSLKKFLVRAKKNLIEHFSLSLSHSSCISSLHRCLYMCGDTNLLHCLSLSSSLLSPSPLSLKWMFLSSPLTGGRKNLHAYEKTVSKCVRKLYFWFVSHLHYLLAILFYTFLTYVHAEDLTLHLQSTAQMKHLDANFCH